MASANVYRRKARRIAQSRGIRPALFEAQINQESHFDPHAGSPAGAQGIAQFMPATARARGVNPQNPNSSLKGAADLMAEYLHAYHGDERKALAAYNAGPGAVAKHGGVPPFAETQNYVKSIIGAAGSSGGTATPESGAGFQPWSVKTGQKTTFDQAGFEQAQKKQIVAQMLGRRHRGGSLFRTGLLSMAAPSPADFTTSRLTSELVKGPAEGGGAVAGDARSMLGVATQVSKLKLPYKWGGGHGGKPAPVGTPVDCSGYVSQILGVSPRTSSGFMSFGKPGAGKQVTIYANQGHVLVEIGGRFFATSRSNSGGGAGEIARPSAAYLSRFVKRHPEGQ